MLLLAAAADAAAAVASATFFSSLPPLPFPFLSEPLSLPDVVVDMPGAAAAMPAMPVTAADTASGGRGALLHYREMPWAMLA